MSTAANCLFRTCLGPADFAMFAQCSIAARTIPSPVPTPGACAGPPLPGRWQNPMQREPGALRNGNPRGDPNAALRCGARTRAGGACRAPAMANGRCRMHGGRSTGPRTAEGLARLTAAHTVHGCHGAEGRAFRTGVRNLLARNRLLGELASLPGFGRNPDDLLAPSFSRSTRQRPRAGAVSRWQDPMQRETAQCSSGVTGSVSSSARRSTAASIAASARSAVSARCRSSTPATDAPSSATITSPPCTPAARRRPALQRLQHQHPARLRQVMEPPHPRVDRHRLPRQSEPRPPHPAVAHQPRRHPYRGVDADREADALRRRDRRGVDADHPRRRRSTSGPPELPGFSGASVWITLSIIRPERVRSVRPERGHDAGGDRALEAERIADRHHQLPDPQRRGAAQLGVRQAVARQPQHRGVGVGILAHQRRVRTCAVGERGTQLRGAGDDMARWSARSRRA